MHVQSRRQRAAVARWCRAHSQRRACQQQNACEDTLPTHVHADWASGTAVVPKRSSRRVCSDRVSSRRSPRLARVTSSWGRVQSRVNNPADGMHLAPRGAAALLRVVRAAPPVHSSLGLARCPALLPREALRPWRPSAAAGAFRCLYARPRYAKPRSTGSTGSTGAADANAAEAAEAIDIQPPFAVRAGLVGAATALMTPLFPVIGFNQLVRLSAHWRTHAVRHSPTYTHTHSRTARARARAHTHTHTQSHMYGDTHILDHYSLAHTSTGVQIRRPGDALGSHGRYGSCT